MADGVDDLKALWHELNAHVEQLASERQHYLEIFERAEEAYLVTDRHGIIEQANGAAVDLLQRRRRNLRGKPLAVLVSPGERREFRARMHGLVNGPAAVATWRTSFGEPAEGEVTVSARVMGRAERGIGWVIRGQR